MMGGLIEVAAAFVGTLGFGFLFNIRGKKLLLAALGGMISWLLFLLLGFVIEQEAVRYFIVAILSTVYAEVFARVVKTPATTFCMVSLIPLVPGSALYYSMAYALGGSFDAFAGKALYTLELTAALSMGIVLATACVRYIFAFAAKRKGRN